MVQVLKGKVKKGLNASHHRLEHCSDVLNRYGILLPPYFPGTLNVELEDYFPTPNWANIICIPPSELDVADPVVVNGQKFREAWELVPVIKINGKDIKGYILRTTTNYHGDGTAQLLTEDLNNVIDIFEGARIEITVTDEDPVIPM
jgi:CTP-dependent riboflavin kinase